MELNKLKELRTQKGLTQINLCEELCKIGCTISRSAYSRYETGSRPIPCDILIKLAVFYETSCDFILGL